VNQEIYTLCMQNILQHLKELFKDSDLSQPFSRFAAKLKNQEAESNDLYVSVRNYANFVVNGRKLPTVVSQTDFAPLKSIFNLLFDNGTNMHYAEFIPDSIPYPTEMIKNNSADQRNTLLKQLFMHLNQIENSPNLLNQLLNLCEDYLSYLPTGSDGMGRYLSMADNIKFSTCLCACIYAYLRQNPTGDAPLSNDFDNEPSLLLFSCDISGIQKFIYTVSGKGALKSLRSRSFYLDMLLEHVLISILHELNLPISNIIYSGGGRAYLLLPNTEKTKMAIQNSMQSVNSWLLENFDISLYIAYGSTVCSTGELFGHAGESAYNDIFIRLSSQLSENKINRYQSAQIKQLNSRASIHPGRECRVCSRSDLELDDDNVCKFCQNFIAISSFLLDDKLSIVILNQKQDVDLPCLRLPSIYHSTDYLYFLPQDRIAKLKEQDVVQIYHFGREGVGLKLEAGTYAYSINGELATFEQLAESSKGISRIAVLRADVDNLGFAFMKGFESTKDLHYSPFLLTAVLSKQLSLFFKRYIKDILNGNLGEVNHFSLTAEPPSPKKLVVVYSGGDDMFLVGAWNDVIEAAVTLRRCFQKYTAGALSFSGGIGMFDEKYPLYAMAEETEKLEDFAKSMDETKNALALFGSAIQQEADGTYHSVPAHCYHWNDFTEKVINEKFRLLQTYFNQSEQMKHANGNAFLYRLKGYIKATQQNPDDKINIARFAYLLARLAPKDGNAKMKNLYSTFSAKMYEWIFNPIDRQQLLTAITTYVYLTRRVNDSWENNPSAGKKN
jgi:CRISPR-associated protein Csm1